MMVSRMVKSSKNPSIKHSVVQKEAVKAASEIKRATIADLINAYKNVMMSAILRGKNKLN